MSPLSFRGFTYLFLIVFLIWSSNFEACIARRGKHWRHSTRDDASPALYKKKAKSYGNGHNKNHGGGSKPKPPSSHKATPTLPKTPPHKTIPSPPYPPPSNEDTPTTPPPKPYNGGHSSSTTFNVLDFGAKGDGKTDDTKAFQAAWAEACKVEASTMVIPPDYVFFVGPISFSGPYCKPNIVFQTEHMLTYMVQVGSLYLNSNYCAGDDCISIQTGCSNVYVHNVNCGPGHGISIGSLGKDNTRACVSNITVRDVNMHNTMTGVRIKTWQGGSGSVQGILFSNIQVSEVQFPIVIDQFYCDKRNCKNQTSAVSLAGINYERIKGTYTVMPVHFACSDSLPCVDVSLTSVELTPIQEQNHLYDPFCWQTYGELKTPTLPPIGCLF